MILNLFFFLYSLPNYIVDIYSVSLIVLFTGCTGSICLTMLMVQVEMVQVCNFPIFHYAFILEKESMRTSNSSINFFIFLDSVSHTMIHWCYWNRYFVVFGHWIWCLLHVKLANEFATIPLVSKKLSFNWIGINIHMKYNEWCHYSLWIHRKKLSLDSLEVFHVVVSNSQRQVYIWQRIQLIEAN